MNAIFSSLSAFLVLLPFCLSATFAAESERTQQERDASAPEIVAGMLPSPSTHDGKRIWQPPQFTHWPAIMYADEQRHFAFSVPIQKAGLVRVGWRDAELAEIQVGKERANTVQSGLLMRGANIGRFEAVVALAQNETTLPVQVLSVTEPHWPHMALRNGMTVDADGNPVVLILERRNQERERRWKFLSKGSLPRPTGRAVMVGDPLTALNASAWDGLDADTIVAEDERYPQHAVIVALAAYTTELELEALPRTVIWSPGNAPLYAQTVSGEEERLLHLISARFEALACIPQCIIALPPLPVEERLREQAEQRREALRSSALFQGWQVVDLGARAGDPEDANRVADGLYCRYPCGESQEVLRVALRAALAQ